MQTNYKFKLGIALVFDGLELDLHNIYYFVGLEYSLEKQTAKLLWTRGSGERIKETLPRNVEIQFERVTVFEFHPRDPEMPFSEDDCLDVAGHLPDEEWCAGKVIETDGEPDPNWKVAFRFWSGAIVALNAEIGTARVKP